MNAVDTNILIYAHDNRDAVKQAKAISLIESLSDGALIWQVASEYLSASRKLEPLGYSRAKAWQDIRGLRDVWTTILPSWRVIDRAEPLLNEHSLSFWDALIIAACIEAGVEHLYSEDFDAYPKINGLEIINPFR
ncbi:MAG: PIN domain-containing protein [Chloroflexi bacterium]|nr:PIN domain-containing protein [Chloroflexota bacterium]